MADNHLRTIGHGLILIAVMLAVIAAALWLRPASLESEARARSINTDTGGRGIPDAGLQRQTIVNELRSLNARIGRLEGGFRSGEFQVRLVEPKTPAGAAEPGK